MARPRGAAVLLGAGALLLLGAASDDLRRELRVSDARARVADPRLGCGAAADGALLRGEPRAIVADALCLARLAAPLAPGPRRAALLGTANDGLGRVTAVRPLWAEALTVSAYVDALAGTDASLAAARRSLALSYAGAPYLTDAADWRIGFGLSQWAGLGATPRRAVIDEAMWRIAVDQDRAPAMFARFRASPAYIPFMLRWRELGIDWQRYTQGLPPA